MKIKCEKCGLESIESQEYLKVIEDLKNKGCTIIPMIIAKCKCGAENSLKRID